MIKGFEYYDLINTIGYFSIFFWVIFNIKEYKSIATFSSIPAAKREKKNFFFDYIVPFICMVLLFNLVFYTENPLGPYISEVFLGGPYDNFFVNIFILPVYLLLLGTLFKISPFKFTDYLAPGINISLIFYKISCFCTGCCYGVPSEKFGMMNYNDVCNCKQFPIQLVECACAVIMLVIILLVRHKKDRKPGLLYPLFILMYCGSRFVSEFWRGDFEAVWGPLKGYHIQCLIGFAEGLVFLFVVHMWGERITSFFQSKRQQALDRAVEKSKAKKKKK